MLTATPCFTTIQLENSLEVAAAMSSCWGYFFIDMK